MAEAQKLATGADALATARYIVYKNWPYLHPALWKLTFVPTPGLKKPTGDAHYRVYYDPEQPWNAEHLAAELVHIIWHLLWNHNARSAGRINSKEEAELWHEATDFSINPPTIREGGKFASELKSPDGSSSPYHPYMPRDEGFDEGLLAEEYYAKLLEKQQKDQKQQGSGGQSKQQQQQQQQQNQQGQGQGSGKSDKNDKSKSGQDSGDGDGNNDHPDCGSCAGGHKRENEKDAPGEGNEKTPGVNAAEGDFIQQEVARAIEEHSKTRGNMPAMWMRFAKAKLTSHTNWRAEFKNAVLQSYNVKRGQVDYSFRYPSRRSAISYGDTHIIIPSMIRPEPKLGLLEDTSGSMSDAYISQCHAEIDKIIAGLNITEITVITNDAEASKPQKIKKSAQIKDYGGGGTDLRVGIQAFANLPSNERPDVLVVLTDGFSPWEMPAPKFSVVIAIIGDYSGSLPSWAKVIRIKEPERE